MPMASAKAPIKIILVMIAPLASGSAQRLHGRKSDQPKTNRPEKPMPPINPTVTIFITSGVISFLLSDLLMR
jgi:type IV pilus biogenesis protein CpaD/CtpE